MWAAEHAGLRRRARRDLWLVLGLAAVCYALSVAFEVHERYFRWLARHERWQADELPLTLLVLALGLVWYAFRRRHESLLALQLQQQAQRQAQALLAHNRELAQGLIALQEKERAALARELHDEIGQRCTALRIETALLRHCSLDDHAGLLAAAGRADDEAAALYRLARDLLRRLRPAQLDELGLVAALQELCESWEQRSGVACVFLHDGGPMQFDDAVDIAVYRIVQEALTNAMRHARARTVRIRLRQLGDTLRLEVEDDGCGMDPAAAQRGLGLLGATERAAALGGQLQVHSQPGAGLRLSLQLPLAPAPRPAPELST